ncbi:MAG: ribosome modulation factor [Alcanivorax sp.]|nr:ribosome modulation factor [Alcanivorax sp.]
MFEPTFEPTKDPFEKAYNRGCMWGMAGGGVAQCPYLDEALAEWWVQGWEAGTAAWRDRREPATSRDV